MTAKLPSRRRIPASLLLVCGYWLAITATKASENPHSVKPHVIRSIVILGMHEPVLRVDNTGDSTNSRVNNFISQRYVDDELSKAFTRIARQRGALISTPTVISIKNLLEGRGIRCAIDLMQFPVPAANGSGDDFSKIVADADAILCVWFASAGYAAKDGNYGPTVLLRARLVNATTKKELFFRSYTGNENLDTAGSDNSKPFKSFNDIRGSLDDAMARLVNRSAKASAILVSDVCDQ